MIEHLKKLAPETIASFLESRDDTALGIPVKLAEYILQIDEAARLHREYHTISECARQLQLRFRDLSISTCKSRIYDSINYLNDGCSVTEDAWLLFYADMLMELYGICLQGSNRKPDKNGSQKEDTDSSHKEDTDSSHKAEPDSVAALREARLCLEKACEYRIRASARAIDPERLKFKHQLVSADMELSRMGVKPKGILNAYRKALSIVDTIDATEQDKKRIIEEVERELNITEHN